ncbi:MAG: WD40 repeat domain-containing protein [Armatimonadetes bacterium]|nr:WD40 repeat domain-containing protein [Armatimonadota bacterium]
MPKRIPCVAIAAIILLLFAGINGAVGDDLHLIWKRPIKPPVSLTIAPGGNYFGTVDTEGNVRFYNKNARLIWQKKIEGATDALIAQNGSSLLVYTKLDPTRTTVHYFRLNNNLYWRHDVSGSIWSAAVSPNGDYVAVGTGKCYLYLYPPYPIRPRWRRWRLEGIVHSLTFTPDSQRIVAGTWQKSAIACYDLKSKLLWRYGHYNDRQYDLQVSADGNTILGVQPGSQHRPVTEVCLWNTQGRLLWRQKVEGFEPFARVSPRSQYVAISFAKYLSRSRSHMLERKIKVYSAKGNLLWEKGGLFFSPRLVAISPTGSSVIASDGKSSLYNIQSDGKIRSKLTLGGVIRTCIPSNDCRQILIYCGDGWLYLVGVR